jgi:hypothetical protein
LTGFTPQACSSRRAVQVFGGTLCVNRSERLYYIARDSDCQAALFL